MSISTELSAEIAVALLGSGNKSAQELENLKELASELHATLEQLDRDARIARERRREVKEERRGRIGDPIV